MKEVDSSPLHGASAGKSGEGPFRINLVRPNALAKRLVVNESKGTSETS